MTLNDHGRSDVPAPSGNIRVNRGSRKAWSNIMTQEKNENCKIQRRI